MDQARDPVTGRPAGTVVDTTQTSNDPNAIADDIRETRAELSDTIGAIGDKLDPSHLVDDAKEAIFSSARDAGTSMIDQVKSSSVLDTIKDNPLPAMAVGLSVAWFLSKVGENESDRYRDERYRTTGDPYYAPRGYRYGSEYRGYGDPRTQGSHDESMLDKASDALESAKDKASDALDTAKDKASDALDSATDAASSLKGSASRTSSGAMGSARSHTSDAGRSLQRYERRAESWLDDQLRRNPLAVGAVALAAGALVGLSVPETDLEDRAFGDQAEAARRQLQSAAQDATEQVTTAAQDVADKAAEKAKSVGKKAESKAKNVGSAAKDRTDNVADSAKKDVKDAKKKATGSAKRTTSASSKSTSTSTGPSLDLSKGSLTPTKGGSRKR